MAANVKKETIDVIDESGSEDSTSKGKGKFGNTMTKEIGVFAKAASVYFETYHDLHKGAEDKKKHSAVSELVGNSTKAHKAAWKYMLENSPVHKENERLFRKYVSETGFDKVYDWLDASDDK